MNDERPVITSTYLTIDGVSSGERAQVLLDAAKGLRTRTLTIQALATGWGAEPADTFKSGAGPVFAIEAAAKLIEAGTDIVVIRGLDHLRQYSPAERAKRMQVFEGVSLPLAYTRLAERFMQLNGITREQFLSLSRALEANYRRTAEARGLAVAPAGTHDAMVTQLFRKVDCANPVVDFEGELVLASHHAARTLGIEGPRLAAVATSEMGDGPDNTHRIATYEHLRHVIEAVDLKSVPLSCALELYTCFPIVPLAFIYCAGWATTPDEARDFLAQHPVTVSGGMNFARAPWNNPALRAAILVARAVADHGGMGVVHGNGGLGGRQGICVFHA